MKLHTKYDYKHNVVAKNNLPSATDPQYAADCDINTVVGKFLRGAGLDVVDRGKGSYIDCSSMTSFAEMMDKVNEGTKAFMAVPSDVRARFGNDPKAFFAFVCDPANASEISRLGLGDLVADSVVTVTPDVTPKGTVADPSAKA